MEKEPKLRILSLGAGVQSSTMALMADAGEFGIKPDAAVFADTGWEPEPVIKHLEYFNYNLDFDNQPYGPDNLEWTYTNPSVFYADHISGCQRLSNGNTLI